MNKIYNSNLKLKQLEVLFNKILIKVSLNVTNRTERPLVLTLLREELQKIICVSILLDLKVVLYSLSKSYSKEIDIKFLVDIIFKTLLLSSKQKIISKLSLRKDDKFSKLNRLNSWLLKDIEFVDYYLFLVTLDWLVTYPKKKNSLTLIESLIENFLVKFSDLMVYELFYESNLPQIFFVQYTTDFLLFRTNFQGLKFYLYYRKCIERIYFFLRKAYSFNYSIVICTKNGFLLKNLYPNYLRSHSKINQTYTPFLEMLNLLDFNNN